MTAPARRDLLAALVALAAGAALPALAKQDGAKTAPPFDDLDRDAIARIGHAWLALNPGVDTPALAKRLFPGGRGPNTLPELRQRVAADFRKGAVFVHRGWRFSDTEGALFGLLTLET